MAKRIISDELWHFVEPHLPSRPSRPKGGRPTLQDRDVLTGIVFVLKTGISWDDLPDEMGCGCGMTCLRRLRDWQQRGIWQQIRPILENRLEYSDRVDWERSNLDARPRRGVRPAGVEDGPIFSETAESIQDQDAPLAAESLYDPSLPR